MTVLGDAPNAGWSVMLRCQRSRIGLKSARPCSHLAIEIDLATLVASHGTFDTLDTLAPKLRCPRCGGREVSLTWRQPPTKNAMQPVRRGEYTLAQYSGPTVVVTCDRCERHGRYRTRTLREQLQPTTLMPDVAIELAALRGCEVACTDKVKRPSTYVRKCHVRFVIAS